MAIEDGQIVLEIVLDDGSIQKGFARVKKEGDEAAKKVQGSFDNVNDAIGEISPRASAALSKLKDIVTNPFIAAGAAIAAVGASVAGAFKLTEIGDAALQAQRSFDIFAKNAGFNAEQLKASFEEVSFGLVDIDDALKASRVAISELGQNASKLPDVFKVAQNAAVTSGLDVIDVYEKINTAILSGNTRALKSIDLYVDSDAALKKYASTIGVAASQLDQAQKQAALLEAVLAKGQKTFVGVSEDALTLGQNVQKLKVAFSEYFEAVGKGVSQSSIGGFFRDATKSLTDYLDKKRQAIEIEQEAFKNSDTAAKAIAQNEARIAEIEAKFQGGGIVFRTRLLLDELSTLKARNEELRKFAEQKAVEEQNAIAEVQTSKAREETLARQAELTAKLAEQQRLYAVEVQKGTTVQEASAVSFADNVGGAVAQIQTLRNAIQAQARVATLNYGQLANTINSGFVGALDNVGVAIANGGDALSAFGGSVQSVIGALASQIGEFFILQGLAQKAVPWFAASAAATFAAGVALRVFGAALGASAQKTVSSATGAPSGGGQGGGDFGGGGLDFGTPQDQFDQANFNPDDVERRAPDTQVVVNIQGDVLDSDETGIRIIDVLNTAFDKKGVTLRRGIA